jgi:hypothetical protein
MVTDMAKGDLISPKGALTNQPMGQRENLLDNAIVFLIVKLMSEENL